MLSDSESCARRHRSRQLVPQACVSTHQIFALGIEMVMYQTDVYLNTKTGVYLNTRGHRLKLRNMMFF